MTTYVYPRGLRCPAATDAALVLVWGILLFADGAALRWPLLLAIPLGLVWGRVTLHFPSRIELDDHGVSFVRYGARHAFAWSAVTRVRLRKFLVRDRVLVRLEPSSPWRGRYWLVDTMGGFDHLVKELEARARGGAGASAPLQPRTALQSHGRS